MIDRQEHSRSGTRSRYGRLILVLLVHALLAPAVAGAEDSAPADVDGRLANAIELAQAAAGEAEESRDARSLEPRYQPREPEKKSGYNSSYLFGITRSVAGSTISPAGKVPLFVLTVPLDIAFLPFAAIGGLFG